MNNKPKNWFYTRPYVKATWIMALASCLMAIASCVMMWTLHQNHIVIKDNSEALQATLTSLELQKITTSNAIQQLQIEVETRKNPELECAYNLGQAFTNYGFVLRNVGNASATNIYLRVSASCITSNSVYTLEFCRIPMGDGIAPLVGKLQLAPGDRADVQDLYVPNMNWLEDVMLKYNDDILVRLYVEYERPNPNYRRYSGYFNFVYSRNWFPGYLQTIEESPRVSQALERFNSIPPSQRFMIWSPLSRTNVWEVMDSIHGRNVAGMDADNIIGAMRSLNWTKHN